MEASKQQLLLIFIKQTWGPCLGGLLFVVTVSELRFDDPCSEEDFHIPNVSALHHNFVIIMELGGSYEKRQMRT